MIDDKKILPENKILEGAHDVKFNFDECATDQSSRVLEDMKLDKVNKIDTILLSATEEKTSPFALLIPYIDFVIPDILNDVVEH